MRLALFIGHHKAGSSSLQNFLSRNWLALARAGILYPSVETEGHAARLAAALRGADDAPGQPQSFNVREAHNALAFKMLAECGKGPAPSWHPMLPHSRQMFAAIANQIAALAPRATVLCSEVMANFAAADPRLIETMRDAFPGARARILCTLRRPDDYLVSWHAQRLKFGHKLAPLGAGGLEPYLSSIHFDYRLMLEGWTRVFAEAEFALRDHRQVMAAGGSIDDFVAQSGLDFPPGLFRPGDINPSIPAALAEVARRGNHALAPEAAADLRAALLAVRDHRGVPPSREVEMFGPEARTRMAREFAPINAWLGALAGREAFFDDAEAIARTRPIPEAEAARAALDAVRAAAARRTSTPEAREFLLSLRLD
ncbi:hypothetical protein [Oceanicella actignis]|uniref:hypothetical protein n=1 Tax=Oceanicella actignis TaxID=1189325 RepID=UPI0011E6CFD2|nr:hypothetical protein [Oceanicella actignis]TYO90836.1 hypothetical protein LY05_00970 [Oceanicella actignis]